MCLLIRADLFIYRGIGGRFHKTAEIVVNIGLIFPIICECASRDHDQTDKNARSSVSETSIVVVVIAKLP